jgi:hypothetical protein
MKTRASDKVMTESELDGGINGIVMRLMQEEIEEAKNM